MRDRCVCDTLLGILAAAAWLVSAEDLPMEKGSWMSKPLSRQDQKKPKPFLKQEKQFSL